MKFRCLALTLGLLLVPPGAFAEEPLELREVLIPDLDTGLPGVLDLDTAELAVPPSDEEAKTETELLELLELDAVSRLLSPEEDGAAAPPSPLTADTMLAQLLVTALTRSGVLVIALTLALVFLRTLGMSFAARPLALSRSALS